MAELLYLDTARLGQMSPTAARMYADFGRVAVEVPTGPCTETFLFHGTAAAPEIAAQYPELARWTGIDGLKLQLKTAFASNVSADSQVLLANRTTELMEFGVRSVLDRCDRVLLTDLTWPRYLLWMFEHFGCSGINVSFLPLKRAVWKERRSATDLTEIILSHLRNNNCDGLFLPAITHTGIKLPIETILNEIHHQSIHTATVIDASQAFGHTDTNAWTHLADFTFGGMHKWVRAYLPLAVGFLQNLRMKISRDQLSAFEPRDRNETMNLAPYLTACGALSDLSVPTADRHEDYSQSISKRLTGWKHWKRLNLDSSLQSRITLVRPEKRENHEVIRQRLADANIAATVFHDGTTRFSSPPGGFSRFTTGLQFLQTVCTATAR